MDSTEPNTVTQLLAAAREGDAEAGQQVVSTLYEELHRAASALIGRERVGHTLQPTALLNEAMLKLLAGDAPLQAENSQYLLALAIQAMRNVLVDHSRRRASRKRGGGHARVPLDDVLDWYSSRSFDVVAVHESLERLAGVDHRLCQVVELRFFGGLSVPEVARQLGISVSTVESDWRFAKAWLRKELGEETQS